MMTEAGRFLRKWSGAGKGGYAHWCPGCDEMHVYVTQNDTGAGSVWTFNGNLEKPDFKASMLIRSGHYAPHFDPAKDTCWCEYNKAHPDEEDPFVCSVCHYFINDGQIQFLGDCTHKLTGQTVPLPEITEAMR